MKRNSDGQQFHKYQENKQLSLLLIFFYFLARFAASTKNQNRRLVVNGVFFPIRAMTLS